MLAIDPKNTKLGLTTHQFLAPLKYIINHLKNKEFTFENQYIIS